MTIQKIRRKADLSARKYTTKEDILELLGVIDEEGGGIRPFCKDHNIKNLESKLFRYRKKAEVLMEQNVNTFHSNGRPPHIDPTGKQNLRAAVTDAKSRNEGLSNKQLNALVITEVTATATRAGLTSPGKISIKSMKRLRQELKISEVTGQTKTKARKVAEEDPRNCFSMIAMCYAFAKGYVSAMLFNWDATQFKVCGDTSILVKIMSCRDDGLKMPVTRESTGETDLFIKLYHYHNASGNVATPVYCLACPTMDAEDLVVHEIAGLGSDLGIGSSGYLIFTQTRCCNEAFYRWYVRTIVVPFLVASRIQNKQFYEDGRPKRGLIYCDGEAMQIKVFQEPDIIDLLRDNCIDLCKTPASCSAICQSSDAGPFFVTCKGQLSKITETSYVGNKVLADDIRAVLRDPKLVGLTDPTKRKVIEGLQQINYIVKENMKPHLIMSGYRRTGQMINDLNENYATVGPEAYANFNQAMSLCTMIKGSRMTSATFKLFENALIPAASIFRERGRITEEEMTELGLPNFTLGATPKDQRPLYKQRSCLMTSPIIIQQYNEYQHNKVTVEASRVITKEERATKKAAKDAQILVNAQARVDFLLLTPEAQKAERKRLRDAKKNSSG